VSGSDTCAKPCGTTADCEAQEDGDPCNGTLICNTALDEPACEIDPSTVVTCTPPDDPCQVAACDPATGICSDGPAPDGIPCGEGADCTQAGTCQEGACVLLPADCDDGDPCTDDACVPGEGCTHTPNTVPCDDGFDCTVGDYCTDGVCQPGVQVCGCTADVHCQAFETDPCTPWVCADLACVPAKLEDGGPCDAGSPCSSGGECFEGQCVGPEQPGCAATPGSGYTLRLFAPSAGSRTMAGPTYALRLRHAPQAPAGPMSGPSYELALKPAAGP